MNFFNTFSCKKSLTVYTVLLKTFFGHKKLCSNSYKLKIQNKTKNIHLFLIYFELRKPSQIFTIPLTSMQSFGIWIWTWTCGRQRELLRNFFFYLLCIKTERLYYYFKRKQKNLLKDLSVPLSVVGLIYCICFSQKEIV